MFQIIKFDDSFFGIKTNGKLLVGTRPEVGGYAIDILGAKPADIYEVFNAFEKEHKNFADFGVNRTPILVLKQDEEFLSNMLPYPKRSGAA